MNDEGASLLEILDELIDVVENAKSYPMSASVKINKDEVLDLLVTARKIVPDQIVAADSVLTNAANVSEDARAEAEQIINQAHEDADTIVAQAREQASRLVSQDAVTIAAKSQATRIVDEAKSTSDRLRRGADDYSEKALAELSARLGSLLDQVEAGRDLLANRMQED